MSASSAPPMARNTGYGAPTRRAAAARATAATKRARICSRACTTVEYGDNPRMTSRTPDSRYAWLRLLVTLALMTIGSGAMYVVAVVLPAVQAEFKVVRADASLPYTLLMVGFGLGGIAMGKLADRFGVMPVALLGSAGLGTGFIAAGMSGSVLGFALAHGVLLGALGSSCTFAPLVADTSLWFVRRRGIAVAICASGNYVAGAVWPPIVQHFVEQSGWRAT